MIAILTLIGTLAWIQYRKINYMQAERRLLICIIADRYKKDNETLDQIQSNYKDEL